MEYLNVSIVPVDRKNTIYFYGETISIDCYLLHGPCHEDDFLKTSEAMLQLANLTNEEIHFNLFVEQINFSTYGAIHGFLTSGKRKKENHPPFIKRLMVWVFDRKTQDCRAFGYYEV